MISEPTVVTNPDILGETYVPADIPAREPQIQELRLCLAPALKKKKPIHAWLFGQPGSGKTLGGIASLADGEARVAYKL